MTSIQIDLKDGLSSSVAIKGPCRVATTANITLSGEQTIDGVAVVADDRVLVKDQTTGADNGIYVADTGAWRRAKDFNKTKDITKGTQINITDGTLYASSGWYVSTDGPIVVGTTAITFTQNVLLNAAQLIALEASATNSANEAAAAASAAASAEASAASAAEAAEAAAGANLANLDSRAALLLVNMPPAVQYVRVAGYAIPGDGGEKLYRRASVPGAGTGKDQSADGSWWETAEDLLDLRMIGGDPTGAVEATALITAAFTVFNRVKLPAGTWQIGSISIPAGKSLLTDGAATVLQQKPGMPVGTRVIVIGASNVYVGDLTIKGNIVTDTDEQNHGIFIQGASNISNIRIGDITGENIRGDVVCIAGLATARVDDVRIGDIVGNNVLRNVLTISGGQDIRIGHVSGSAYGLYVFDLEPNPASQLIKDVDIAYAKGVAAGIVPPAASVFAEHIRIGTLDLNPAYASDSTPAYGHRAAAIVNGLWLRNCRAITVDYMRAYGYATHAAFYVYNAGEMQGDNINFGFIDIDQCSLVDTTYNAYFNFVAVLSTKIGGGRVNLISVTKGLLLGGTTTVPWIENLSINGRVITASSNGYFSRIVINNAAFDTYAFLSCNGGEVVNSTITLGRLAGSSHGMSFRGVTATCATFLFNSTFDDHFIERCTFNGTYHPYGYNTSGYLAAISLGVYNLWVETATGNLRVKAGAPTTDADGTVVGTQA